jgi:hypothetical protein
MQKPANLSGAYQPLLMLAEGCVQTSIQDIQVTKLECSFRWFTQQRCKKSAIKQPRSCNFAIWWDGDLFRELLDKNYITKWDFEASKDVEIFRADSCTSINGTKATPNLSADLFGDWREEVVLSNVNKKN